MLHLMKTRMTFCHHQPLWSLLSQPQPVVAVNPRTRTRLSPLRGLAVGYVGLHLKLILNLQTLEKCLKGSALVLEDEGLPKTPVICLPPRPTQTTKKPAHPTSFKIPPNLPKPHLLSEITRLPKPGLYQIAPIPVQCLPPRPLRLEENSSVLERLTAKTPNQADRRKKERVRGGYLSHQ